MTTGSSTPPAPIAHRDPFDIWALPAFGGLKRAWYGGRRWAVPVLACAYLADIAAPILIRRALRVPRHAFAHVLAFRQETAHRLPDAVFVAHMAAMRSGGGWGLPFRWYSKNGVYPENTPLITASPYVMAALLRIDPGTEAGRVARQLFRESWGFLSTLRVQHETSEELALSYAPFEEPHIVVNANSYAALAYAMHAVHGRPEHRAEAEARAARLVRWVAAQQHEDGRWYYLAERGAWDMIDGFHSCFVIRNLLRTSDLLPDTAAIAAPAARRGWAYVQSALFDTEAGLCRRYAVVSRRDPFRYDLYDQAEFLGLLVRFGELNRAERFAAHVARRFHRNGAWYCRIDKLGRLWGRDFTRWGIAQFEAYAVDLARRRAMTAVD